MKQRLMRITACLLLSLALTACVTVSGKDSKQNEPDKRQQLANIHYRLGIDALGKEGMLPKAFDELMESDEILPNQPEVLDALAYAWLLRGDLEKSETYYLRAIRHGGGASIYNNYASLLNRLKRHAEAEKAARKSLDDPRYPNQDLAFINLGNALLGQKKHEQAIQAFHQAKVFNPRNRLADLRLAHAYFMNNQLRESRLLYEMILRKQPNNRIAVEGLVNVLETQDDTSEAMHVLNQFGQQASSPMDKAWAYNELERIRKQ